MAKDINNQIVKGFDNQAFIQPVDSFRATDLFNEKSLVNGYSRAPSLQSLQMPQTEAAQPDAFDGQQTELQTAEYSQAPQPVSVTSDGRQRQADPVATLTASPIMSFSASPAMPVKFQALEAEENQRPLITDDSPAAIYGPQLVHLSQAALLVRAAYEWREKDIGDEGTEEKTRRNIATMHIHSEMCREDEELHGLLASLDEDLKRLDEEEQAIELELAKLDRKRAELERGKDQMNQAQTDYYNQNEAEILAFDEVDQNSLTVSQKLGLDNNTRILATTNPDGTVQFSMYDISKGSLDNPQPVTQEMQDQMRKAVEEQLGRSVTDKEMAEFLSAETFSTGQGHYRNMNGMALMTAEVNASAKEVETEAEKAARELEEIAREKQRTQEEHDAAAAKEAELAAKIGSEHDGDSHAGHTHSDVARRTSAAEHYVPLATETTVNPTESFQKAADPHSVAHAPATPAPAEPAVRKDTSFNFSS